MVDDAKRRASDALIQALMEGICLIDIIELAMDDIDAADAIQSELSEAHSLLTDTR